MAQRRITAPFEICIFEKLQGVSALAQLAPHFSLDLFPHERLQTRS